MLNVSAYLARIGYSGPIDPTAPTLCGIHRAHMFTVPFENLDIGLGRKIVCDEETFIRKIVEQRRGGFCYEMNGAFAVLLRALGFRVTLLSARATRDDGSDAPEFDHLALRVDLDGPWLADVGFGDSFVDPLCLKVDMEQQQGGRMFRIVDQSGCLHLERTEADGNWKRQYSFSLVPRQLSDFAAMCHYHQTSPESPFTRKRVCSQATPEGRITLADGKLILTRNGKKQERMMGSIQQWNAELKERFGLIL